MKLKGYPARFEPCDHKSLSEASKETGFSINQLLGLCVRQSLANVVAANSRGDGRVTNVEPLSAEELARAYDGTESDEAGIRAMIAAQPGVKA